MSIPEKPPARRRDDPAPAPQTPGRRRRPLQLALAALPQEKPSSWPVVPQKHLWFGICLPALPLEVLADGDGPMAVFEDCQGMRRVLLANRQAAASGIGPGLTVNAALALEPALALGERNPAREAVVLGELAEWAEQFTSFTCIEAPSLLLLEIAGSLTLFGGLRALRERIVRGLDHQGFTAGIAIAPTPLAATWLARAGRGTTIRDPHGLAGGLSPLPLSCLDWPASVQDALHGMGVMTVGEALRLPRAGFARRFGAGRLLELDRALGRLPDPRVPYRSPERFIADFDLNEEQDDRDLLLNACSELLIRLERFLCRRQVAVQHIEFAFFHLRGPATHLELGCVQPDRAVRHWFELLRIRFERLQLPAPVIAIRLSAGQGQAFVATTGTLRFHRQDDAGPCTPITHLAERLGARIGDESVHGVMTVAEHRPQYAWRPQRALGAVPPGGLAPGFELDTSRRPLWMLGEPQRLDAREGLPHYRGPLELVSGPERIETGWWDGNGIARDYFVAVNPRGMHLWVYRDRGRERGCWFLHGMFG